MELHERLKQARGRRFRTAREASEYLGIPYGTLTGHESGARGVKRGEIMRYARAYGVDVPWLEHELGPTSGRQSYLDLLLFPLRCSSQNCGADFNIAIRWLVSRESINCPHCGSIIDIKQLERHIDNLARVASELDKLAE